MKCYRNDFIHLSLNYDEGSCIGCYACMIACMDYHHLPADKPIMEIVENNFRYQLKTCRQCGDGAACIKACKKEAISVSAAGVVVIDPNICTGCMACSKACPFGAIVMAERFGRMKALKCMLCSERDDETPLCMQACVMDCIHVIKGQDII